MGQLKHLGLDEIQYKGTQFSFRKEKHGRERKNKKSLQKEYVKAKHNFESEPNDLNANILNSVKDTMELFYEEKVKGIIIRA